VRAVREAAETTPYDQLNHSGAGGHPRLRTVLADHLNRSRGAAARPAGVSVYAGAGQSLLQVCRALAAEGHTAIGVEDPGSPRHHQAVRGAGLEVVPVPIDGDGLIVEALPAVRAVCVSPAHHPVTGGVLSPRRRAELLDWASRTDALIVEDDYDAEFAYDRAAPAVLQAADPGRVALLGSMSKSLGPAVGIGWVVAPGRWVPAIRSAQGIELHPPMLTQVALAILMESGGYDRHLRASRPRYRARRNALVAALHAALPRFPALGAEAGLHLLLELPPGSDTAAVVAEAHRHDLDLCDTTAMTIDPANSGPALMLGYGNLSDSLIEEAVTVLAEAIGRAAPE
jgi:GntR family transcriptional regulator/MocR family aminotransferase